MKHVAFGLMVIAMMSCKSSKPGTQPNNPPPAEDIAAHSYQNLMAGESETVEGTETLNKMKATVWRLIVEFYSIGEGTDMEAKKRFDLYLSQWHEAGNPKVNFVTVPWGREGEADFCFTLAGMSAEQQQQFIDGLREQMSSSKLVRITENEKCTHFR
jgi:hypothetical protein